MKNDNIFIHIPKTGGTTINCAINGTEWQTKPDFNYRHILYDSKRSNSKDIFDEANYEKFQAYKIFTIIRDPADRLLSEYYFIRDRQEFMANFKKQPRNFEEYIKNRQSQNYMIGFLVGKKMFDPNLVTASDLESVLKAVDELPIYVGLFEYFSESMTYFEKNIGIKWPKKIEAKRVTINRPKKESMTEELKALIYKNNALDVQFYNHCKEKFLHEKADTFSKKVHFEKNKYNYVLKYTQRFPLIALYLKHKTFTKYQNQYFHQLAIHLQKNLQIKDGRSLAATWNHSFINALNKEVTDQDTKTVFMDLKSSSKAPLEVTEELSAILDNYLKTKGKHLLKKPLTFDDTDIEKIEIATSSSKNEGFFSKIKSLFSK